MRFIVPNSSLFRGQREITKRQPAEPGRRSPPRPSALFAGGCAELLIVGRCNSMRTRACPGDGATAVERRTLSQPSPSPIRGQREMTKRQPAGPGRRSPAHFACPRAWMVFHRTSGSALCRPSSSSEFPHDWEFRHNTAENSDAHRTKTAG